MLALEFFSGIGGLHCALNQAAQALKISAKVLASFDVNPNANAIYAANFPDAQLLNKVFACPSVPMLPVKICHVKYLLLDLINSGSETDHGDVAF